MIQMVIILSVLCAMLAFSAYFANKPLTVIEKRRMRECPKDELIAIIIENAKSMRTYENGGNGIRCDGFYREIVRANYIIEKKVESRQPLSDSEKWFYENFYLVYRFVFSGEKDMRDLPHINGEPRIICLARIIVDNSLGDLNAARVRYILGKIKEAFSFTYKELREFNNAIGIALIEQIYILSERLNYNNECKKLAKNGKFNKRYISRDVYLYHLLQNKNVNSESIKKLDRLGIEKNNVLMNYNFVMMRNTMMAETLFGALMNLNSFAPLNVGLKCLGAYTILSEKRNLENIKPETLCEYFARIEKIAERTKVSEDFVAKKLNDLAEYNGKDISTVLFDYYFALKKFVKNEETVKLTPKKEIKEIIYSILIFGVSVIASISLGIVLRSVLFGISSFVPVFFIAENIVNYLLSHLKYGFESPAMNYKKVPYEHSVMIVVSEFITSIEQLKESIIHAETLIEGNKDENISVGLLLDTKGENIPVTDLDREIIDYVSNVNLKENINVFLRKKCFSGNRFISKERKRGAIMALAKLLIMHEDFEFLYIKNKNFITPNYILTLDADNSVLPGEVIRMVNMMAHPYNKKYDLLAMKSRNSLYSIKNLFSSKFVSESGFETYPNYSGLYYKLFGQDIFSGKGIFRLEKFYNKLEEILPSGKILSHDVLEGSILKTGCGGLCFEDAPENFLSDRERRKRWQRGDIQLFPFLFGLWKNDGKKKCRTQISSLGRFVITKNIFSVVKDACILTMFIAGLCLGQWFLITAAGIFVFPYILNQIKILRRMVSSENVGSILKKTAENIIFMVEDFFMLGYYAIDNLIVLLTTSGKMLFKKNLLEWKTYYSSQKAREFTAYIREFSIPTLILTGISAVLWGLGFVMMPVFIYLLATFLMYFSLYLSSVIYLNERDIPDFYRKKLEDLAQCTYKYFCFMRNKKGLIGDNLQIKPYKGIEKSTSPTNIAFGILAEICANELKFISFEECVFNLTAKINVIDELPKWNGNLYNWYNIDNAKNLNEFVSSVDNGNLIAVLMLASEYLKERGESLLALKAEKIVKNMQIDKLYDKSKNLFYIGYDGKEYCGHYDLLASESRILSFVYIALYNDYVHYACLQKDYTGAGGNVLLSWSGTMFEMLMADIFFMPPRGSVLFESEKFNVKRQIKNSRKGVWGISESGYYAFDSELKYQYGPFGIKELALSSDVKDRVVSPYASVLALRFAPRQVLKNIEKLYSLGLGFEYGLYESIDFTETERTVCSAMTHHQGMILAAITNYLNADILSDTLGKSPKIKAVISYFNDVRPTYRISAKKHEKHRKYNDNKNNYYKNIDNLEQYYSVAGLTDSQYTVICNALGGGLSKTDGLYINRFSGVYEENNGMFFFADQKDNVWRTPTFLPFGRSDSKFNFAYSGEEVFYSSSDGLGTSVSLLSSVGGEVRRFSADEKFSRVAFYFEPCIDSAEAFDSHPSFRNLFCNIKIVSHNTVLVTKRMPGTKGIYSYLAIRVEGVKNIEWECNKLNFIGRGNFLFNADFLFSENYERNYSSIGDVLTPCIGFKAEFTGIKNNCQVTVLYGKDEKILLQTLASMPEDMYRYARQSVKSFVADERAQALLGQIIYAPNPMKTLCNIVESGKIDIYKKYSDMKKVVQYIFDENMPENVFKFIEIISQIRVFGIEVFVSIYSHKKLPENTARYIKNALDENRIIKYKFIDGICDEKYWASIELQSDLSFTDKPLNLSKIFIADRNLLKPTGSVSKLPEIVFFTGNGGYDSCGRYIVSKKTLMPYCNVIGHKHGGVIITADGDGFYYFRNSREDKCVRFDNDSIGNAGGEKIYVKTISGYVNILGGTKENAYSVIDKGKFIYNVDTDVFSAETCVGVLCDGEVKYTETKIVKKFPCYLEYLYCFYPVAGWRYEPMYTAFSQTGNLIRVYNIATNKGFYVKILGVKPENLSVFSDKENIPYFELFCENSEEKITIVSSNDLSLIHSLTESNIPVLKSASFEYFSKINDIDITSPEKSFDYLVSYLPYQILSSRLNAKSGFYQVGGAIGFRDQLQDSLAFFTRPEIIKERIIAACIHQYEVGDVMHWWHEPNFGLRTRITDDKLFLPYAVCKYIEYSGDTDFLKEEYPYLSSSELQPWEKDRFENPPYTSYKETVFTHCLRAIRSSLRYGEHRLLVMGKGDWNDGMDEICSKGRGESVFNSMFCYMVLRMFSEHCPDDLKNEMNSIAVDLKNAINIYAYETDRYKRLFSDDGRWLGSERSETLKLDLLVQAFAVISDIADGERARICLETAEKLIDREHGLIKLLSPSLTENDYLGYISDYPKGIRENGGQYTHAAMWYLIALVMVGRQDDAFELFQMINPVEKCRTKEQNDKYMCEPYVLCGDIYSNKDNPGHGGWSWYTGSAGWAYKLVTEYFYGLKRKGDELYIEPSLPKKLRGSVIVYRYKNSSYVIEFQTGLLKKIIIDGIVCDKIKLGENVRKKILVETGC